jgi:hypothetical protein
MIPEDGGDGVAADSKGRYERYHEGNKNGENSTENKQQGRVICSLTLLVVMY